MKQSQVLTSQEIALLLKARFTKQTSKYDCGPVVIANLMKWLGRKFSYRKNRAELKYELDYVEGKGTKFLNIMNYLGYVAHKLEKYKNIKRFPNIKYFDKVKKNAAVVIFTHNKIAHHVSLYIGRTKKYYYLINESKHSVVTKLTRKEFKKFLNNSVMSIKIDRNTYGTENPNNPKRTHRTL